MWVQLPGWALSAPTDADVAVRARLDSPATVGGRVRHARLCLSRLGLDRLPSGSEPTLRSAGGRARLAAIQELDASGNELGRPGAPALTLAGASSLGASLTALDLSGNGFGALALYRCTLPPQLASLDLSTNAISALPPNVLALRGLVRLSLSRNKLAQLPARLGASLPSLEALDLSHNELAALAGTCGPFPRLSSLGLRANRLVIFELGGAALPRLASLDLGANRLARPSGALCSLRSLTSLNLSSNQLVSLLAAETAPRSRAWVPSGLHQLGGLRALSLAQNRVVEIPTPFAAAFPLLADLDVRCNPLSAEAQQVLAALASGEGAARAPPDGSDAGAPAAAPVRVRSSVAHRLLPGLLLGDPSIVWDVRTLRSIGVTHIVRVGQPAEMGASRHARPVRADEPALAEPLRILGLSPGGGAPGALLEPRAVRDAFLRAAKRFHPDSLGPGADEADVRTAEAAFAAARGAYEAVCEAARAEAVQLPTFGEIRYHHLSLAAAEPHTGGTRGAEGAEGAEAAERARREAIEAACRALDEANRFIHEARSAPAGAAVVLVHAATGWARAAAVVSAYMVASAAEPLEGAFGACAAGVVPLLRGGAPAGESALGALPAYLAEALRGFEAACVAQRRRVDVVVEKGADVSRAAAGAGAEAGGEPRAGGGAGQNPKPRLRLQPVDEAAAAAGGGAEQGQGAGALSFSLN